MLRKEMKERITVEESRNPEPEAAGREVLPIQENKNAVMMIMMIIFRLLPLKCDSLR